MTRKFLSYRYYQPIFKLSDRIKDTFRRQYQQEYEAH